MARPSVVKVVWGHHALDHTATMSRAARAALPDPIPLRRWVWYTDEERRSGRADSNRPVSIPRRGPRLSMSRTAAMLFFLFVAGSWPAANPAPTAGP